MSLIDSAKEHPFMAGTIGVVIIVALVYVVGSSGTTTTQSAVAGSSNDTSVAAGAAIQQAQLAANAHIQDTQAALQANQDNIGGQISLATIAANMQNNHDILAASIASQQIDATSQTADLQTTLGAQVTNHQIDAAIQGQQIASTTSLTNTKILTDALVGMSTSHDATAVAIDQDHSGLFGGGGFLGLGI